MKIKIIGIGKCGSRVAYDLFAYTTDIQSAYEIRLERPESKLKALLAQMGMSHKLVDKMASRIRVAMKAIIEEVSGLYRIAEQPFYVTIDSDTANNEIVNDVLLFQGDSEDEKRLKEQRFPCKNFTLNDHTGGCNFHVVSESITRAWNVVPNQVIDSDTMSIFVTSFSVAGGTGGGSGPVICQKSRNANDQRQNPCHYMGLGVLPKSDEVYMENEPYVSMSDYEKFSTGRFFVSLYGKRIPNSMNSMWIFSNDTLRFLVSKEVQREAMSADGGEMTLNLSLVNFFMAQSLTVLANSSSKLTSADSNVDPKELNDFLGERPFVSGLARQAVSGADASMEHHVLAVQRLLLRTLSNVRVREGRLEGLSVPVPDADLIELRRVLEEGSANYDNFADSIRSYDASRGPLEFSTTRNMMIFYGQPEKNSSEEKKQIVESVCDKIFPNARKFAFNFRHHASTETLLLLLVDPLIQPIISSIYYYANNAWSTSNSNRREEFDDLISAKNFKEPKNFSSKELFPVNIYGGGMDDVQKRIVKNKELAVKREHIVQAFKHLHEIFHYRRPSINTSSRLRNRR